MGTIDLNQLDLYFRRSEELPKPFLYRAQLELSSIFGRLSEADKVIVVFDNYFRLQKIAGQTLLIIADDNELTTEEKEGFKKEIHHLEEVYFAALSLKDNRPVSENLRNYADHKYNGPFSGRDYNYFETALMNILANPKLSLAANVQLSELLCFDEHTFFPLENGRPTKPANEDTLKIKHIALGVGILSFAAFLTASLTSDKPVDSNSKAALSDNAPRSKIEEVQITKPIISKFHMVVKP